VTTSMQSLCEMVSRSTGKPCQQPERWLERCNSIADMVPKGETARVCQVHGKQLEREGWTFVRELHPVPGYERKAVEA
jgi:hypothetical protein